MKYGKLDYDFCTNRMDVAFSDGTRFGGLHCGEPMEVKMNGRWTPTRIEYGREWYIVAAPKLDPTGMEVRM